MIHLDLNIQGLATVGPDGEDVEGVAGAEGAVPGEGADGGRAVGGVHHGAQAGLLEVAPVLAGTGLAMLKWSRDYFLTVSHVRSLWPGHNTIAMYKEEGLVDPYPTNYLLQRTNSYLDDGDVLHVLAELLGVPAGAADADDDVGHDVAEAGGAELAELDEGREALQEAREAVRAGALGVQPGDVLLATVAVLGSKLKCVDLCCLSYNK